MLFCFIVVIRSHAFDFLRCDKDADATSNANVDTDNEAKSASADDGGEDGVESNSDEEN